MMKSALLQSICMSAALMLSDSIIRDLMWDE